MSRKFSHWLKAYVEHCRHTESPEIFHFWTAVSTVAGALRRRVWIDERTFQWTPNFYIVLVAPPGIVAKSTSIRIGMNLLKQIKGIKFGPQSMTWQALLTDFKQAKDAILVEKEVFPMSCLTIAISELGTFLRPDDGDLMNFLIAMWDGQQESFNRHTVGQGYTDILNPWLNVIGCTTPEWLERNFDRNAFEGGLGSRMIFAFANKKAKLIPYPSLVIPREEYKANKRKLFLDLQEISNLKGEYVLSSDALEYGIDWYENLWTSNENNKGKHFSGYIARKQTHLHKLAMVIAASKRNKLLIFKEDMQEANGILEILEKDMRQVIDAIAAPSDSHAIKALREYIQQVRSIKLTQLYQHFFTTLSQKDFVAAVQALVQMGEVKTVGEKSNKRVVWASLPIDKTKDGKSD